MRISISDIAAQPGARRSIDDEVDAGEFGSDPWGPAEGAIVGPIRLALSVDSVIDGVLVRGIVGFRLDLPCSRCLATQRIDRDVDVSELFSDPAKREPDDDDEPGYDLLDDNTAIDLSTMVRDALLIDLPVRILCREDCQGLCPICGIDRNSSDCGHTDSPGADPRWSVLAELDLPDD